MKGDELFYQMRVGQEISFLHSGGRLRRADRRSNKGGQSDKIVLGSERRAVEESAEEVEE